MNNLVSRNPVQRFKQGRKIVKAEDGWRLINGKAIKLETSPNVKQSSQFLNTPTLTQRYIIAGKQYGSFDGGKTYYSLESGKPLNSKSNQILINSINKRNILSDPKKEKPSDLTKGKPTPKKISTPASAPINYGLVGGVEKGWHGQKGVISNTDDLAMLKEMGYEGGAKGAQNFINENLIKYGLGSNHIATDDMWGTQSQKGLKMAYDAWKNGQVAEQPTISETVSSPSIQTPVANLGYRTSNTYEGNDFYDRLKTMGIGSNADLIDFMHKTNGENYNWNGDNWARQFRSDVNKALGGNYSDANIRKIFNTSGNWGRGFLGRGDIGDFQNALQTNAGIWNGSYDRNLNNYIKNDLGNYVKNIDWTKFKLFKQGGSLLPSKNIVTRFKNRNFM